MSDTIIDAPKDDAVSPDELTKYTDDLWDLRDIKPGTKLAWWIKDGIRYLILRGPSAFTVYFGIPLDHPLANFDYDDIPVDVHGGLTFAGNGDGKWRNEGYYWYGWDYGHFGDRMMFDHEVDSLITPFEGDHTWTLGEVRKETAWAHYSIRRTVALAEKIARLR